MSVKQVIVIRKDLNMRKGKMVAQGAHASLIAVIGETHESSEVHGGQGDKLLLCVDDPLRDWLRGDHKKICVGVASEGELLAIYGAAKAKGLRCPTGAQNDGSTTHSCTTFC
jgi:PTH2 family peptidyl-tRNA hydrolase